MNSNNSEIISMGISFDDRGSVRFLNSLDLIQWKRFYIVENNSTGFIRAWHGHKYESKLMVVLSGSVLVGTLAINDFENPSKEEVPIRRVIHASANEALYIPAGNVNGFMSLTSETKVMFFSSSTLEQSKKDDYRFNWDYWNIWEVKFR